MSKDSEVKELKERLVRHLNYTKAALIFLCAVPFYAFVVKVFLLDQIKQRVEHSNSYGGYDYTVQSIGLANDGVSSFIYWYGYVAMLVTISVVALIFYLCVMEDS
jgi:amino acid transporter